VKTVPEAEAALERARWELEQAKRRAAWFGAEPPVGSVIKFSKRYPGSGRRYDYAAIRVDPGWFLTGQETGTFTWPALCNFIGAGNAFQLATEWTVSQTSALPPGVASTVDGTWGRASFLPTGEIAKRFRVSRATMEVNPVNFIDVEREALRAAERRPTSTGRHSVRPRHRDADPGQSPGAASPDAFEVINLAGDVVASFNANDDGYRRALQSARDRDRNLNASKQTTVVISEPALGARVCNATGELTAIRNPGGWLIKRDGRIWLARASWPRLKRVFGAVFLVERGES
jgi:hypothetical protein